MKLIIITKCNQTYEHENVSKVRESKNELRWVNARAEKRSMALAFIFDWKVV